MHCTNGLISIYVTSKLCLDGSTTGISLAYTPDLFGWAACAKRTAHIANGIKSHDQVEFISHACIYHTNCLVYSVSLYVH